MKISIKSIITKNVLLLLDKPFQKPSESELTYYEDFKNEINAHHVKYNVNPSWKLFIEEFREHVNGVNLHKFLRWSIIEKVMGNSNDMAVFFEFIKIRKSKDWVTKYKPVLNDIPFGYPEPFVLYPKASGRTVHNLYHIMEFQSQTGVDINSYDTIIEFGGGYGNLCRLIYRLGFKGRYLIYDIYEFSILQKLFLRANGILKRSLENERRNSNIELCHEIELLIDKLSNLKAETKTLFIATWSLSEAPINLRDSIIEQLPKNTSYLLAYQKEFDIIDNEKYFDTKIVSKPSICWKKSSIKQLTGSYYLFGVTK